MEYRHTSLGLVARHLNVSFHTKKVLFKAFWDPQSVRQGTPVNDGKLPPEARLVQPSLKDGLKWEISAEQVQAEMKRQGCQHVDFKFCLEWHAHEFDNDGPLCTGLVREAQGSSQAWCSNDQNALAALAYDDA